jgi:hypothetical protein
MPAGPIGTSWAPGSWSDTVWEIGTWADLSGISPNLPEPVVIAVSAHDGTIAVPAYDSTITVPADATTIRVSAERGQA